MSKRNKYKVKNALLPGHLQAIGMVAAAWSNLEGTVIYAVSQISGIPFHQTLILMAPSAFAAWMDILCNLVSISTLHSFKSKQFSKFCEELKGLQTERNSVVHAAWHDPNPPGLGLLSLGAPRIKPQALAKGVGIPKRGKKIAIPIEKTAKDMRAIAAKIEAAQSTLFDLLNQQPPASTQKLLVQALLARQNLPNSIGTLHNLPAPSGGLLGALSPSEKK